MQNFLVTNSFSSIREALAQNPALVNQGIPYDDQNTTQAHPLHRICDGVFSGIFTDAQGVELANIFLAYGADVNGNNPSQGSDSPLTAASSLHADLVALLYMSKGADINHEGGHGGTALHWAAWCGRDKVVAELIRAGAEINKLCTDFRSTPLSWAIRGLKNGGQKEPGNYLECVKLLVRAGADKKESNRHGKTVFDLLEEQDHALREVLNS